MLKIALIQQSCSWDINENQSKTAAMIREAAENRAELICLQELHKTPYFCQVEDVNLCDLAETIPGESTAFYSKLAREENVVIVTSLFEKRADGLYHNTSVVFEKDGSIAGMYRKMHIPDDPSFYEKFYFTPGDIGFEPIQTSVGKLGVLVCWDQWYPEAARLMAMAGAQILIYPTAIGYTPTDPQEEKDRQRDAWVTIQRSHAVANGLFVASINRVGLEEQNGSEIKFWGTSFVCGPQGEFLVNANEEDERVLYADIDLKRGENVRRWWPFFRDRRIDFYGDLTKRWRS